MTEDLLASFRRLAFNELDQAPESPGLYAWYGVLRSGRGTWGVHIEQGSDQGEQRSRKALRQHTEQFANAPLEVNAESAFSASWSGKLQDQSLAMMRTSLDYSANAITDESSQASAPKLQTALQTPSLREKLFRVIELSTPILAAPLYIGVAENLRDRLGTHKHNILIHARRAADNKHYFQTAHGSRVESTFAFRAAKQGFTLEDLEVWVLDLSELSSATNDIDGLRTLAEACEWLLNRWHRPKLGRK